MRTAADGLDGRPDWAAATEGDNLGGTTQGRGLEPRRGPGPPQGAGALPGEQAGRRCAGRPRPRGRGGHRSLLGGRLRLAERKPLRLAERKPGRAGAPAAGGPGGGAAAGPSSGRAAPRLGRGPAVVAAPRPPARVSARRRLAGPRHDGVGASPAPAWVIQTCRPGRPNGLPPAATQCYLAAC